MFEYINVIKTKNGQISCARHSKFLYRGTTTFKTFTFIFSAIIRKSLPVSDDVNEFKGLLISKKNMSQWQPQRATKGSLKNSLVLTINGVENLYGMGVAFNRDDKSPECPVAKNVH